VAVAGYHDLNKHYPPAFLTDAAGRPLVSWRVLMLPYMEQGELHKRYDLAQPWDSDRNQPLLGEMPSYLAFHGDYRRGLTITNYLAVVGPETVWPGHKTISAKDVTDGTSNTIFLPENLGANIHWTEPRDLVFATMSFQLNSPDGVGSKYEDPAVAMLDATVRRLGKDTSPEVLRAMFTVAEDEVKAKLPPLLPDGRDRKVKGGS
jgi:hypothetical protein